METDLYEIWQSMAGVGTPFPWRARLHGYVACFSTEDLANKFVAAVKKERARPLGMIAKEPSKKRK